MKSFLTWLKKFRSENPNYCAYKVIVTTEILNPITMEPIDPPIEIGSLWHYPGSISDKFSFVEIVGIDEFSGEIIFVFTAGYPAYTIWTSNGKLNNCLDYYDCLKQYLTPAEFLNAYVPVI